MVPGGKFVESPGERRVRRVVDRLLKEPREISAREARGEVRQPFFRPVSLALRNGPVEKLSAFTREISASGVGLLHNAPIPSGETVITLTGASGTPIHLRAYIVWCKPCGEGWYLSGAHFIDVTFSG